jgi:hypothetical protein
MEGSTLTLLRWVLALAVLAYAGWLAWPFVSPFLEGASPGAASMRAEAETAGAGALFGVIPTAALWIGAVVLYLLAALLLGSGNPRAAVAYFLGFIADAAFRLALDQGGGGPAARSTTMAAPATAPGGLPVDPLWLVLGALLILGLLIVAVSRRRKARRSAGYLAA